MDTTADCSEGRDETNKSYVCLGSWVMKKKALAYFETSRTITQTIWRHFQADFEAPSAALGDPQILQSPDACTRAAGSPTDNI